MFLRISFAPSGAASPANLGWYLPSTPTPEQFHLTRAHACPQAASSAFRPDRPAPHPNPARHGAAPSRRPRHTGHASTWPSSTRSLTVARPHQCACATTGRRSRFSVRCRAKSLLCSTNKSGRFTFLSDTDLLSAACPWSTGQSPIGIAQPHGGRDEQHVQGLRHQGLYVVFRHHRARRRNGRPLMACSSFRCQDNDI